MTATSASSDSPDTSPSAARIFGLDALRAAAILSVATGHALNVFYTHWPKIGLLGHGGFYGVELFFVLSGFLIGGILLRTGDSLGTARGLGTFYARRWFRTLPLFWLFIAVNVALEWVINHRLVPGDQIAKHTFFVATFAANRIYFIPESFSLAIEEWFYLLLPAALWLGLQCRVRFRTVFLIAASAFYLFSTFGRILTVDSPDASWVHYQRVVVLFRFDALMTGVFAAWVAQAFPAFWRRAAWPLFGLGVLLALAMYASLWRPEGDFVTAAADGFFARTYRFNLVSLGFALLLPAMSLWKVRSANLAALPIRQIALWSYAMYLVHQPVIHVVQGYLFTDFRTSVTSAVASFATQIGASIAISALVYRFFEAPITRLRERFAPPTPVSASAQ